MEMAFKRPQCFVCGAYEPTTAFCTDGMNFVWACGIHKDAVVDLGETILRDGYADAKEWEKKWNLPETSAPTLNGPLTSLASRMDLPDLSSGSKSVLNSQEKGEDTNGDGETWYAKYLDVINPPMPKECAPSTTPETETSATHSTPISSEPTE